MSIEEERSREKEDIGKRVKEGGNKIEKTEENRKIEEKERKRER